MTSPCTFAPPTPTRKTAILSRLRSCSRFPFGQPAKYRDFRSVNWGTILSRSWLASRALDHLLSPAVDFIDKTRVTISGHSRNGKQAMLAGAFDERVTAVVSSSSGSPVRARTLDLLDVPRVRCLA